MSFYDEKGSLIDTDTAIRVDDIVKVAAFICRQPMPSVWGNVKRNEAFEALCRLVGIKNPSRVFEIMTGDKYIN